MSLNNVLRLVLLINAFVLLSCEADRNTIYVSPEGDDTGSGNLKAPVASVARALEMVRASEEYNRIVLRGGVYYLDEGICLNESDSGTEEKPFVITAYNDEKVIISGALEIKSEWLESEDGVYKCKVSGLEGKEADQLFVNGKRQVRARYPNGNSLYPDLSAFIYPLGADDWPHQRLYYNPETFTENTWSLPEEAIIHIFPHNHWGNLQIKLEGINYQENYFDLVHRAPQINETFFKLMSRPGTFLSEYSNYFVDNVMEELDTCGEWYFDKKEAMLYYMAPDNVDMQTALFEIPVLEQLVSIRGGDGNPAEYIEISGICFSGTTTTYMDDYEYPSLGDWGIVRSGALFVENAYSCSVKDCFFDAVGGNAIFINDFAESIEISGNLITECGESAVCLVGKSHLNTEGSYTCSYCGEHHPWSWGEPSDEIPVNCIIDNNLIHDIGVFGKQVAGVFLSLAKANTISHNHIYNTPRAGICLNDGWHGGHIIEFNDVHNTVRETGDHGPLNSWGRETSWCRRQSHGRGASHEAGDVLKDAYLTTHIRNNRFTDNSGWGIDLDDGSSNYKVYNNLCIGVSVKLREGDYRTVENNIFYKGANPPSVHRCYENNHDIFRRNIVVVDTLRYNPTHDVDFVNRSKSERVFHFIAPPEQSSPVAVLDSNLYTSSSGIFKARMDISVREPGYKSKIMNLEEWNELGFDRNSVIANPGFTDPENGDFTLKPDSPVKEIGFIEFELDKFGLEKEYKNKYRKN